VRLDCGCCVLRPWSEGDDSSLVRHANNYEVWRRLRDGFPHPYTHADAERWIAFAKQQNPQRHFAIEVHGEATGGIGLELRSDIERPSAEMGYWLGQDVWACKRGVGHEHRRGRQGVQHSPQVGREPGLRGSVWS
jgi:ribosomal-protein-alanine N-acetyltransferase